MNEKSQTQPADLEAANNNGAQKSQDIDPIQVSTLPYHICCYYLYFCKITCFSIRVFEAAQDCGRATPPCCYKMTAQVLKEPLQRAALDISLDTWNAKRYQEFNPKPLKYKM